jgi:arylsulfatase A-like enzyme
MYARWPGRLPAGATDNRLVANIDLAPTIMDAADVTPRYRPDGRSLLDPAWARHGLLLEGPKRMWRSYLTARGQYVRWRGGSREYYDTERDPFQQHNALASRADVIGSRHARAGVRRTLTIPRRVARREARRLQRAMHRAGRCSGRNCP